MAQTVILDCNYRRDLAKRLVDMAPPGAVLTIAPPKRSIDQNSRFWAMLSDVSRAMPGGRRHTPEVWKCLFMHAMGHSSRFEMGLNNEPFPMGFSSSQLNKNQMGDLMTFMEAWGAEQGVQFREVADAV
jgi:NinB protein